MATLMLLSNPRPKGKKKMATRKRRSSAQVAATKRLVAFNKSRRRVTKSVKRRVKRAGTAVAKTYRRVSRHAVSAVRRRRSSGSSRGLGGGLGIKGLVTQAGIGAVGALAVDLVYSKLPLPASLKVGNTAPLVKAGITIGLGILAGKVVNKQMSHNATVGALTVQLHQFLKGVLPASMQAGVAGYTDINGVGYYTPAQIAQDNSGGMGEYMSGMAGEFSEGDYSYN